MNIAYLILAHKNPEQLIRLIRRLEDKETSFFIHLDQKSGKKIYSQLVNELSDISQLYFLKRYRCYWGGFDIVNATIEGIKTIFETQIDFDYVFLISGQDYLIKPKTEIKIFINQNKGQEFIESFSLYSQNRWSNCEGEYQALNRVQYWYFRYRSRYICWKRKRKFPLDFEPHGGSQWWCLSRECLEYINNFIPNHPEFVNYFKYVFIPDEVFFQTIIANSPFRDKIANDDVRYADWGNPNPFPPAVLDKSYFEILKKSPKLFARKFDIKRDSEILDLIDREILGISNR
jgi:hypothetical protein